MYFLFFIIPHIAPFGLCFQRFAKNLFLKDQRGRFRDPTASVFSRPRSGRRGEALRMLFRGDKEPVGKRVALRTVQNTHQGKGMKRRVRVR